jgi:hypothetical protein
MSRFSKLATSALVAVGLVAGQLATSASASAEWRQRGYGYDRGYGYRAPPPKPYYGYRQERRRDRTGDAVGAVVLGLGALIVGAAIADAARNKRRHYD